MLDAVLDTRVNNPSVVVRWASLGGIIYQSGIAANKREEGDRAVWKPHPMEWAGRHGGWRAVGDRVCTVRIEVFWARDDTAFQEFRGFGSSDPALSAAHRVGLRRRSHLAQGSLWKVWNDGLRCGLGRGRCLGRQWWFLAFDLPRELRSYDRLAGGGRSRPGNERASTLGGNSADSRLNVVLLVQHRDRCCMVRVAVRSSLDSGGLPPLVRRTPGSRAALAREVNFREDPFHTVG